MSFADRFCVNINAESSISILGEKKHLYIKYSLTIAKSREFPFYNYL